MRLINISDERARRAHPRSAMRTSAILAALVTLAVSIVWIVPQSARADGRNSSASNVLYVTTNDPTPARMRYWRSGATGL